MNSSLFLHISSYSSYFDLIQLSKVCKEWNHFSFLKIYESIDDSTIEFSVTFERNNQSMTKKLIIDRQITLKELTMYIIILFKPKWPLRNGSKNYYRSRNIFLVSPFDGMRMFIPREDKTIDDFHWYRAWMSKEIIFVENDQETQFYSGKSVGRIFYLKKQIQKSTSSAVFFQSESSVHLLIKRERCN